MKTCPKCNKPNSDNTKCFYCGADLSAINGDDATKDALFSSLFSDTTAPTVSYNSRNSEKINIMANVVCVIGIILAVILGFIFQIATVKVEVYSTGTTYSYNWGLLVGTVIATLCFTIILKAMSYIAKAIEEK